MGQFAVAFAKVVQVQVYSQFAHLSVIVGIGSQRMWHRAAVGLICFGLQMIHKDVVQEEVSFQQYILVERGDPVPVRLDTDVMVVCNLPVGSASEGYLLVFDIGNQEFVLLECGGCDHCLLEKVACLPVALFSQVHTTEDIHPALAVIDVERASGIVECLLLQRLLVRQVYIEAEALSLAAHGADAYNAAHRCVILGARVVDYLHALDLVAQKAVKLAGIGDLLAINIYKRRSFSNNLNAVVPLDYSGNLSQDVFGRSHVLKHGTVHGSLEAFACQFCLWHHRRDHGFAQKFRVFLQDYRGEGGERAFHPYALHGVLVAHEGYCQGVFAGGGGKLKGAVRIGGYARRNGAVGFG